jgi:hypothetical protein
MDGWLFANRLPPSPSSSSLLLLLLLLSYLLLMFPLGCTFFDVGGFEPAPLPTLFTSIAARLIAGFFLPSFSARACAFLVPFRLLPFARAPFLLPRVLFLSWCSFDALSFIFFAVAAGCAASGVDRVILATTGGLRSSRAASGDSAPLAASASTALRLTPQYSRGVCDDACNGGGVGVCGSSCAASSEMGANLGASEAF